MAVILSIDPSENLALVVQRLKNANVNVTNVLESLHIVTVEGDAATIDRMRVVPGVIGAEPEGEVHLDPREVPDMGPGWPKSAEADTPSKVEGASWRSPEWDRSTS